MEAKTDEPWKEGNDAVAILIEDVEELSDGSESVGQLLEAYFEKYPSTLQFKEPEKCGDDICQEKSYIECASDCQEYGIDIDTKELYAIDEEVKINVKISGFEKDLDKIEIGEIYVDGPEGRTALEMTGGGKVCGDEEDVCSKIIAAKQRTYPAGEYKVSLENYVQTAAFTVLDINWGDYLVTEDIGEINLAEKLINEDETLGRTYIGSYTTKEAKKEYKVAVGAELDKEEFDKSLENARIFAEIELEDINGQRVYAVSTFGLKYYMWPSGNKLVIFIISSDKTSEAIIIQNYVNDPLLAAYLSKHPSSLEPAVKTHILKLRKGETLVSVPLVLEETRLEVIFGSVEEIETVYGYDADNKEWKVWHRNKDIPSDLKEIEPTKAYWIKATAPVEVSLRGKNNVGAAEVPVTTDITKGWNLIGLFSQKPLAQKEAFLTIQDKYASLYEFYVDQLVKVDTKEGSRLLQPGTGYWLYALEEGEIPS